MILRGNVLVDKSEIPILQQEMNGRPLVYLDNAATSQKPQCVIDCLQEFYSKYNANVHRGAYKLSAIATQQYEDARALIASHIGAKKEELVFVRGATEAINLVADSFVKPRLQAGDEIIVSVLEHHANLVPWLALEESMGIKVRPVGLTPKGQVDEEVYDSLLNDRTKFVALSHVSNVLGSVLACKRFIEKAHARGIPVLIDGAQAMPHMTIDVKDLDADFYVFSSHKAYGPTGVGCLYGKFSRLSSMQPYQKGGSMIREVTFEKVTYLPPPLRFEAGTPAIAEVVAFARAIRYLQEIGLDRIAQYESQLTQFLVSSLEKDFPEVTLYGCSKSKTSIVAFTYPKVHPHDVATIFDSEGVAIRAGHHCAMPLMMYYKVPAMLRVSLSFYNDKADVEAFLRAMMKVREVFG